MTLGYFLIQCSMMSAKSSGNRSVLFFVSLFVYHNTIYGEQDPKLFLGPRYNRQ